MKSKGNIVVNCKQCNKEEKVFKSRAENYKFCSKQCVQKSRNGDYPIIGDKINNWVIIESVFHRMYGRSYFKVKCSCGSEIEKLLPRHHLNDKKSIGCKSCSMFHTTTGYKRLSGDYWSMVKFSAKRRNIEFDLNIEDAYYLIEKQDFKCSLSGLNISFNINTTNGKKHDASEKTASLDRIDSKKGYTIDNVQWVHKDVNIIKNKFNQDYFIKICKLICKNN